MLARTALLLALLGRADGIMSSPAATAASGLTVNYFAYGSNLAASVREGRRKLKPFAANPGFVRNRRLAFNMPGMGLAEPSFASLKKAEGEECHGGVFELSVEDCMHTAIEMLLLLTRSQARDFDSWSKQG